MFTHFWGVGLVLTSLFVSTKYNGDLRNLRDFFYLMWIFLSLSIFGLKNRGLYAIPFFILLSFFTAYNYNSPGFNYQFLMLSGSLLLLMQFEHKKLDPYIIKKYLIFMGVISGLWAILNYYSIEPYHYALNGFTRVSSQSMLNYISGPLLNNTISAPLCSIGILLLNRKSIFLAIPMIAGLYLYSSTMAILMTALGLIYRVCSYKRLKPNLVVLFVIGVLGLLYWQFQGIEFLSGQERNQVWLDTLKLGSFKGLGYFHDNFRHLFKHNQVFIQEHNEYLSLWVAFGLPGIAVFLMFLSNVIGDSYHDYKAAFVAMLFLAAGSFPFHISSLALISIMLYTITKQGVNYGIFKYKKN